MGGRGSASGMSDEGKRYGTEYKAIAQFGNVKVVKYNGENGKTQAKTPKETMTPGRIYATVDKFYDIKILHFTMRKQNALNRLILKGLNMPEHCHIPIMDMSMKNMEHILVYPQKIKNS